MHKKADGDKKCTLYAGVWVKQFQIRADFCKHSDLGVQIWDLHGKSIQKSVCIREIRVPTYAF